MNKKPDPEKAIYIGKRKHLPPGVKSCTVTVQHGEHIPELHRMPVFYDGMTHVPVSRWYMRRKTGPVDGKIVGGELHELRSR